MSGSFRPVRLSCGFLFHHEKALVGESLGVLIRGIFRHSLETLRYSATVKEKETCLAMSERFAYVIDGVFKPLHVIVSEAFLSFIGVAGYRRRIRCAALGAICSFQFTFRITTVIPHAGG